MLEHERVLSWDLKVDRAATELAYRDLPVHSKACSCQYCLNFERACDAMPAGWWELFRRLGIDPKKASGEVYQNYQNDDGSQSYGGIFHVCGEIVGGPDGGGSIGEYLDVVFSREAVLVDEHFPRPLFQVEITTTMPWVLHAPPPESAVQG